MMVDGKVVVGTGSLKLPNLRENLKLLQEREIKQSTGELTEQKRTKQNNKMQIENNHSHSCKTPLGGDTYPPALLKVDESTLHRVSQCCIQHGEDRQVGAEVRHNTAAEALRTQIKQQFYILVAQLTKIILKKINF